ncbi:MAG: hypothetical protein Q8933_08475 [Bacteroidota bacterium]|nr:hypothetical protein [Bacteroidota bacterium]MDP4192900.1 hypothetical protein [Bacteroidota bacterium]
MKKLSAYILITLIPLLLFACSKPLPTELVGNESSDEQSSLEFNTISSDDELLYKNGYDSTGTDLSVPSTSVVISASSIKTTYKSKTEVKELAEAAFFDREMPVKRQGGKLLGYRTKLLGVVSFNNLQARVVPFMASFREHGAIKDTLLGSYFLLYKNNNSGDPFNFVHDSNIHFRLKGIMNRSDEFEISTPKEISAEVDVSGSLSNNDLSFKIKWDKALQGKIQILISGLSISQKNTVPFAKIYTDDKGLAKIPSSFLKDFPLANFDRIVFTLSRRKTTEYKSGSIIKDNTIVAQTIHSIQLDIPK